MEGRKIVRILGNVVAAVLATAGESGDAFNEDDESFYSSDFSPETIGFGLLTNPFQLLPTPDVVETFEEDLEFSRQFLAGYHPVMIQRCLDPESELTSNILAFATSEGLNVTELAEDNRLYYASYHELDRLSKNPHDALPEANNENSDLDGDGINDDIQFYFHAPIVVFIVQPSEEDIDDQVLNVFAIQLDRNTSARVFSRNTSTEEEWLAAKMFTKNADANIHEWVSHLGLTHITMDPHLVAIHNVLRREEHPIWDLLQPVT